MNKEILTNTVSRLLGVSSSEKEFAFQIFIEKTAEVLGINEAIKYDSLGFFYFKEEEPDANADMETLLFVPLKEETGLTDENYFLSFEVKKRNRPALDFDPSVFSLSIDKSTLPFESSAKSNADISYQLLKKTIEERVAELIEGAVKIENFNMLDSFNEGETRQDEIVFSEENDLIMVPEDSSYEEMIFNKMNLQDSGEAAAEPELSAETAPLETAPELEDIEDIVEVSEFKEPEIAEPELAALEDEAVEIEVNADVPMPEDAHTVMPEDIPAVIEEPLVEDASNPEPEAPSGEKEWEWSAGIIEDENEIPVNPEKEDIKTNIQEPLEENKEVTQPPTADPFAELEKVLEADEKPVNNMTGNASPEHNTDRAAARKTNNDIKEDEMSEEQDNNPVDDNNYNPYDDSNQKRNMILISALILIVLIAVYIIIFNGFGIMKKSTPPQQTTATEQTTVQPEVKTENLPQAQPLKGDEVGAKGQAKETDKMPVQKNAKAPVQAKTNNAPAGSLIKDMKNETKVGINIFSDGGKFYVQVSSWKNMKKAEDEVKKLKAKGENAFMVKAYIEKFKGTWYRVRVGTFNTKEEAEAYSKKHNIL